MGHAQSRLPPVRYALAALLVVAVGIAARFAPRHWTPLPLNPDGFVFAAQARDTLADGTLAVDAIDPHGFAYPTLLAQLELITDASALSLTQPTIAVIGTIPCLFAFTFTRRITRRRGWSPGAVLTAATVAGLVLATEGLYLRRTATVSYEVLGILLVVSSAYAFHRLLAGGNWAWLAALLPCLVVLPVTHHLSSMMAALTLTALAAIHARRSLDPATIIRALPVVALFWLYFGGYYILTEPPFFGDLAAKPGLFLAWVLLLPGLVVLFARATPRLVRVAFAVPFLTGFAIVVLNTLTDVFPGTATTHPRLLVYVTPLLLLLGLAVWGIPLATANRDAGPVILGLFLGPLAFVGFGLTAGLTPEYTLFARRGQTFAHLSLVVAAGVAVAGLGARARAIRRPALTVGIATALLGCALVSIPFAFAGPPVLPYEVTTTSGEFAAVTFADERLESSWTSDDHLTRVARNYYGADASPGPTYEWLQGGTTPACPVAIRESWPATGAQANPSNPIPVDSATITTLASDGNVVYAGDGESLVVQRHGDRAAGC